MLFDVRIKIDKTDWQGSHYIHVILDLPGDPQLDKRSQELISDFLKQFGVENMWKVSAFGVYRQFWPHVFKNISVDKNKEKL